MILETCGLGPEALDTLDPEERHVVYKMLGLTVGTLLDGSLKVSGAFGEETGVWAEEETSRRSFTDANPPRLEFTLISKNDMMETSFELGYHNIPM